MSGTLMLVNPRKRRARKSNPGKKRRSAKQRAATRRLVAFNRGTNPVRRRRSRRRSNPISYRAIRRSAPKSLRRHRRRRNPIGEGFTGHNLMSLVKTGVWGAGGALATDFAMGNLPLPANVVTRTNADGTTNFLYYGTKAVFALALGALGKRFLGHNAHVMAEGSMIVNMYDLIRTLLPASLKLGYFSPAALASQQMGAYIPGRRLSAYIPGTNQGPGVMSLGYRPERGTASLSMVPQMPRSALATKGRASSKY